MDTVPILLLLNRTAGDEAGFDMSTECTCLIREIRQEKGAEEKDEQTSFPLLTSHSSRFDSSRIQAVQELGAKCSSTTSLIRVFRLHPMLSSYARIESRDGFEWLDFDVSAALAPIMDEIHQLDKKMEDGEKDYDGLRACIQKLLDMRDAIEIQEEWKKEDEEQWMTHEDQE